MLLQYEGTVRSSTVFSLWEEEGCRLEEMWLSRKQGLRFGCCSGGR